MKRSSGGEKEAEENIKVTAYRKKTNTEISLPEVEFVVIKILMKLSNLMKTVNMAYLKQKKKNNKNKQKTKTLYQSLTSKTYLSDSLHFP